jgi:transposase-like protein
MTAFLSAVKDGGFVGIITGVQRRRHWRLEQKLRSLAELDERGSSVGETVLRHEVSRGLLRPWRD